MNRGSYKELVVWQKAKKLFLLIVDLDKLLPPSISKSLGSQMLRSSLSISSNIAEGNSRGDKARHHYLEISFGSSIELESQLNIAAEIIDSKCDQLSMANALCQEVIKMLYVMKNK